MFDVGLPLPKGAAFPGMLIENHQGHVSVSLSPGV